MKAIVPIILIITSIGIFTMFTNKTYQEIKTQKVTISKVEEDLKKSEEVLKRREDLQTQYNKFTVKDLDNLKKLLPDHVDNIQLILDINGIAAEKNLDINNINISNVGNAKTTGQQAAEANANPSGPAGKPYDSILVSFGVKTSYENFIEFMNELQKSLRIVDMTSLSFKAAEVGSVYDYSVTLRTYWLK